MSFPYPNLSRLLQLRRSSGRGEGGREDLSSDGACGGMIVMRMTDEPSPSVVPAAITEFDKFLHSCAYTISRHGPYYNPTSHAPNPSHNNLFGGMYKIEDSSPDIESEFHSMMLAAIRAGGLYGICENRTAYSALYFDLDFKGPPPVPSIEELTSILVLIREVLHRIGGDSWHTQSHALLAISPAQEDPTMGLVKLGAHIIFPNIILDYESLLRVNMSCREHVESMVGIRRAPANTWTDVFDTTMYRTGLRMLFVDKNKKCEVCNSGPQLSSRSSASAGSAPRPSAPGYHKCTNGFVGQNRPYTPVKYWHATHGEDEAMRIKLLTDPLFALHVATIRKPKVRKQCPSPPSFDASLPTLLETRVADASARRERARQQAMGELEPRASTGSERQAGEWGKGGLSQKVFVDMNDPRMLILQSLIRNYDPERFSSLTLRSVSLNATLTTYTAHVAGPGRHACLNCYADSPHSRSVVYFLVDAKQGLTQKCTSRSEKTDRVSHRPCRLFRGAPWKPVPKPTQRQLFSNVKTFSSMNMIIDNGNVYVPDWNIVTEEEQRAELAEAAGAQSKAALPPRAHRIETMDSFSPHRPEPSSAIRVSNANVVEHLKVEQNDQLRAAHHPQQQQRTHAHSTSLSLTIQTNPTSLKIPPTWQKLMQPLPPTRKRSISQESSCAPPNQRQRMKFGGLTPHDTTRSDSLDVGTDRSAAQL